MAENTTLAFKVTADTQSANTSVKSFKTQLREATSELVAMSEKFGVTSVEAANAAKKVAGLKDAIGDAKALAETFNPDKKFVALGGALQGAVGGFSALQGAMGLFGSEGKEVEKMMLKVQSAMALQQGISGIMGAKDSFTLLAGQIKGNVTKAFGTLKGAIISTGIGILVIALGLLIANFDEVKKFMEKLFPGLAKLGDFFGGLIDTITDFIGVTSEAGRAQEKFIKDTEKNIKKNQEVLDADGYKYDQYTQRKIKANIDYQKKVLEINKDATLSEKEKHDLIVRYNNKANFDIKQADTDRNKAINDEAEKQNEKRIQKLKTQTEKELQQAQKKADELKKIEDNRIAQQNHSDELILKNRIVNIDDEFTKKQFELAINTQKEIDAEQEAYNKKLISLDQFNKNVANINATNKILQDNLIKTEEEKAAEKKLAADAKLIADNEKINNEIIAFENKRIENKKAVAAAEKQIQDATFSVIESGLNLLHSLAGKNKALQAASLIAESAVGIAKIIINTQAANALAKANPVNLATAGAFGISMTALNNVSAAIGIAANIKATATGLRGLNAGGAPSAPGGMAAVGGTSAPLTPQAQSTRLDQGSINAIGQASARSYVLESDITSHQERIQRLNRAARIN